jgi:hypothetical protein
MFLAVPSSVRNLLLQLEEQVPPGIMIVMQLVAPVPVAGSKRQISDKSSFDVSIDAVVINSVRLCFSAALRLVLRDAESPQKFWGSSR